MFTKVMAVSRQRIISEVPCCCCMPLRRWPEPEMHFWFERNRSFSEKNSVKCRHDHVEKTSSRDELECMSASIPWHELLHPWVALKTKYRQLEE